MGSQNPKRIVIKRTRQTFSQEHKVGFILVACMGGLAFILGGLYLMRHLASPFDFNYSGPMILSIADEKALAIEDQKNDDTDNDGLSDYDELYIYKTSPYLKDSDGDGYTDETEIRLGTDPNCKGDECESYDNTANDVAILGIDEVEPPVMPEIAEENDKEVVLDDETIEMMLSMSVVEKREMILSAGLSQSEVDLLTDEQVEILFTEVLSQIQLGESQE